MSFLYLENSQNELKFYVNDSFFVINDFVDNKNDFYHIKQWVDNKAKGNVVFHYCPNSSSARWKHNIYFSDKDDFVYFKLKWA